MKLTIRRHASPGIVRTARIRPPPSRGAGLRRCLPLLLLAAGCAARPADSAGRGRPAPSLAAFARALGRVGTTPVAVLQIGDSHTANDGFSGRLRELMQERFGDSGRGMLPPGVPYDYYRPATVHVTEQGWERVRSGSEPPGPGPFGLAGLRQHALPGATSTLEAPAADLARATIEVMGQPGGGTVEATTNDGRARTLSTAAARVLPLRLALPSGRATTAITLVPRGDGPVDLLAWTAARGHPGVSWSNLGSIGATVDIVLRWDPAFLRAEGRDVRPALIVVAFGTNEGFKDSTDLATYPATFRTALRALHLAAPGASMLVLGPPGGVRRAGAGLGAACPDPGWIVPENLPRVRAIERRVASEEGAAFWDWAAAMGGDCPMVAWAQTDPPLAAHDHVHLLKPGYRQTAEALYAWLMQAAGVSP